MGEDDDDDDDEEDDVDVEDVDEVDIVCPAKYDESATASLTECTLDAGKIAATAAAASAAATAPIAFVKVVEGLVEDVSAIAIAAAPMDNDGGSIANAFSAPAGSRKTEGTAEDVKSEKDG